MKRILTVLLFIALFAYGGNYILSSELPGMTAAAFCYLGALVSIGLATYLLRVRPATLRDEYGWRTRRRLS